MKENIVSWYYNYITERHLTLEANDSKVTHYLCSGYVILKGKGDVLHTQSINLTGDASIFQAELIAIQEAAKHLTVNEDTWGLYIKFFSDSQAALQALKSNTCKAQTVKDTHDERPSSTNQTGKTNSDKSAHRTRR